MRSPIEQLREELYGDGPGSLSVESMFDVGTVPDEKDGLPLWDNAWGEEPKEDEIDDGEKEEQLKAAYIEKAAKKGEATVAYQKKQSKGAANVSG